MAESDFEAIVRGQKPYTPEEWTGLGLDEEFPSLEPVSAVGLSAINLYEERDKAEIFFLETQYEVVAMRSERYSVAELDEARLACIFADEQVGEFQRLYGRILNNIEYGQAEDAGISYEGAVKLACRGEIFYAKNDPNLSRENRVRLVYFLVEMTELYLSEPDSHFSSIRSTD